MSPGFHWGTTLLPQSAISVEDVMAQTAITYPGIAVRNLTGAEIKDTLEDIADNLFNPDPYYRQGGDMVRVSGLTYACAPRASIGQRISDLRLNGVPLDSGKPYRVAGWASVTETDSARHSDLGAIAGLLAKQRVCACRCHQRADITLNPTTHPAPVRPLIYQAEYRPYCQK